MAEERVDRARKMVRRISSRKERRFAFHITYVFAFFFWVYHYGPNSRDHLSIYALHGEPLFFQHFDGPYFPTLRLLHKCE